LEAFLISVGLVSLAEIGDKTMLLAGTLAAQYLDGPWTKRIVGIAFLGFAVWALIPDTLDVQDDQGPEKTFAGVFWTTTSAFSWSRWATRPRSPRPAWPSGSRTCRWSWPARPWA